MAFLITYCDRITTTVFCLAWCACLAWRVGGRGGQGACPLCWVLPSRAAVSMWARAGAHFDAMPCHEGPATQCGGRRGAADSADAGWRCRGSKESDRIAQALSASFPTCACRCAMHAMHAAPFFPFPCNEQADTLPWFGFRASSPALRFLRYTITIPWLFPLGTITTPLVLCLLFGGSLAWTPFQPALATLSCLCLHSPAACTP